MTLIALVLQLNGPLTPLAETGDYRPLQPVNNLNFLLRALHWEVCYSRQSWARSHSMLFCSLASGHLCELLQVRVTSPVCCFILSPVCAPLWVSSCLLAYKLGKEYPKLVPNSVCSCLWRLYFALYCGYFCIQVSPHPNLKTELVPCLKWA